VVIGCLEVVIECLEVVIECLEVVMINALNPLKPQKQSIYSKCLVEVIDGLEVILSV